MIDVVILAAGKGTRMRSEKPKVLHGLAGKPLIHHVVEQSQTLSPEKIVVVVGHGAEQVKASLGSKSLEFVEQKQQLGTGHAVLQALPHLSKDAVVLVLYGDVPLIKHETLSRLAALVDDKAMALLTVTLDDPFGYGRIVRNGEGAVTSVVEQKDANREQQAITEVNTGVIAARAQDLQRWLPALSSDNAQQEYLLPDIIAMARDDDMAIKTAQPHSVAEVLGINNRVQQAQLEREYQRGCATTFMEQGLTLLDPSRFDCRGTLTFGRDCVIDVNCVFEGNVVLGDNVSVGPNCHIADANIADNVEVKAFTSIEKAELGENSVVGPYARLRPEAKLGNGSRVGNFVEIKKAHIGEGSKVNHLSYVGDAIIGESVNVGAGTITCNYDGANKSQTRIDDGAFIGSNTALVAPVSVGKDATIAAGSVITSDVSDKALAVARSKQRSIDGWVRPTKKSS